MILKLCYKTNQIYQIYVKLYTLTRSYQMVHYTRIALNTKNIPEKEEKLFILEL